MTRKTYFKHRRLSKKVVGCRLTEPEQELYEALLKLTGETSYKFAARAIRQQLGTEVKALMTVESAARQQNNLGGTDA